MILGLVVVFFPGFTDFYLQLNWEPHLTENGGCF